MRAFAAALLAAAAMTIAARAEGPAAAAPVALDKRVVGHWTGAKLRCQKEEDKLLRCGTPAHFEITFADNGTGSTPDENLPKDFSWRWLAEKEIAMKPRAGGEETKLFAVEREEERTLSFQAYVYLPTLDPTAPVEARYIHYVFDVNRAE